MEERPMALVHRFLGEVQEVVIPRRTGPHGPLPPLLLGLTLVTGLVDAFSYLVLGRVFVANMTGNVVFLGFAVAGASGFSVRASRSRRSWPAPSLAARSPLGSEATASR